MPISDCEVRDPRIRRTRQLLQGALRGLMHTRNFEEISVQDIAEAATVNRATFYDHYTDKFALLDALIGGGFHHLLLERNVEFTLHSPEVASAIILAACDFQVLMFQESGGCKGDSPFAPLIDAAIINAMRRVFVRDLELLGVASSFQRELLASTASAAIHAAAKQWFQSPNRPSVEEVVPQISALVSPVFERAASLAEIIPSAHSSAQTLP